MPALISRPINPLISAPISSPIGILSLPATLVTSIQQFTIAIDNAATTNTATISAVNAASSIIIYDGVLTNGAGTDVEEALAECTLTNSTTVTATRGAQDGTKDTTIRGVVVEFNPRLVASVEYGTVNIPTSASTGTATLATAVPSSRAAVIFLGSRVTGGTTAYTHAQMTVDLTGPATVTGRRNSNSATLSPTARFAVIRFVDGAVTSVQQVNNTASSSTATSATATLTTPVDTTRTVLFSGGTASTQSAVAAGMWRWTLTNKSTVTWTRDTGTSANNILYVTAVEFSPNIIKSIQRGTIAMSAVATNTATVTAVTTTKAFANYTGLNVNSSATNANNVFANLTLTNTTTLTAARSGSTGLCTIGYELVEFY